MALLASELARCKAELGYNLLAPGAAFYADVHAIFEQVVATYLNAGATTTSSTTVAAASTPTPVTLTLASATGFSAGDNVSVDVDSRQESGTVQAVSGSTITLLLSFAHSGTYPVSVEGGESLIREDLRKLRELDEKIQATKTSAGLKSVGRGAVEWFGSTSAQDSLSKLQMLQRDELASKLGVPNLWRLKQSAGLQTAIY